MEPIGVLLEGVASVFRSMASTLLITLVSIVVVVLTLVLLNSSSRGRPAAKPTKSDRPLAKQGRGR